MKQLLIGTIAVLMIGAVSQTKQPAWQYAEVVENTSYTIAGAKTSAVAHLSSDSTLMTFGGAEPVRWASGLDGINYLGEQGWELVSVHSWETQKYRNTTYTLKRRGEE